MSIRNLKGEVQDRTYTSVMEDYLKALPKGTAVTAKMLEMHGIPERLCANYMHFFVKWKAAKRVEGSKPPAIIYTPEYDTRQSTVEWRVPDGPGARPREGKKPKDTTMPYMTKTGNELTVAPPPPPPAEPEKVQLDDLTLDEVRRAFKLLLGEFGLKVYRKGGTLSLEP